MSFIYSQANLHLECVAPICFLKTSNEIQFCCSPHSLALNVLREYMINHVNLKAPDTSPMHSDLPPADLSQVSEINPGEESSFLSFSLFPPPLSLSSISLEISIFTSTFLFPFKPSLFFYPFLAFSPPFSLSLQPSLFLLRPLFLFMFWVPLDRDVSPAFHLCSAWAEDLPVDPLDYADEAVWCLLYTIYPAGVIPTANQR